MITLPILCIVFDCSESTAKRRIKQIYEVAGIKCPETTRIPLSLLTKYKGITKQDIEFAMYLHEQTQKGVTNGI